MDAVVVEISADGRVRLENETWTTPTLQEKRAIIYSAYKEVQELDELLEILDLQHPNLLGRYLIPAQPKEHCSHRRVVGLPRRRTQRAR